MFYFSILFRAVTYGGFSFIQDYFQRPFQYNPGSTSTRITSDSLCLRSLIAQWKFLSCTCLLVLVTKFCFLKFAWRYLQDVLVVGWSFGGVQLVDISISVLLPWLGWRIPACLPTTVKCWSCSNELEVNDLVWMVALNNQWVFDTVSQLWEDYTLFLLSSKENYFWCSHPCYSTWVPIILFQRINAI